MVRGENVNGEATGANDMMLPQEIRHRIARNSTSGYMSKRMESRESERYSYTVFIANYSQ